MSVHYEHRHRWTEQKNMCTLFPQKKKKKSIVDYLLTPSASMFIGQGLTLEAGHAAQAERRSANTIKAPASAAAAAVS